MALYSNLFTRSMLSATCWLLSWWHRGFSVLGCALRQKRMGPSPPLGMWEPHEVVTTITTKPDLCQIQVAAKQMSHECGETKP